MFRHRLHRSLAGCDRIAVVASLAALLISTSASPTYSTVPSISLGKGRAKITEFDANFQPIRSWTGLERPVDITPLSDGTILVVDEELRRVILLGADGAQLWSEPIVENPVRARPRPGGGYLVTSGDGAVVATRPDRAIEWKQTVANVRTAVPLPNGNIIAANNQDQGWLTELTPGGKTVWQSDKRAIEPEQRSPLFFVSVWPLDVGADGSLFAAVFDGTDLRVVKPNRKDVEKIPGMAHTVDTRIGPKGELVAVSAEAYRVWIRRGNGRPETFSPPMRPISANISPSGTIFVGMTWDQERSALRASALRREVPPDRPWWQQGLPLPIVGTLIALVIGCWVRREELRRFVSDRASLRSHRPVPPAASPKPIDRRLAMVGTIGLLLVCGAAVMLAWSDITALRAGWVLATGLRFLLACAVAGVCLRLLNSLAGSAATLSTFIPQNWPGAEAPGDRRMRLLVVLALGAILLCAVFVVVNRNLQAAAVALWLAAQIFIFAAAFPPRLAAPGEHAPRWVHVAMIAIMVAAVITRFWEIGYFPDFVHHDHVIYGDEALSTLRGDWSPFFARIYSVGRPTFVSLAAALELFGHHYWVLRLNSAIAGVVIVWGTYLLGTTLYNYRVGVFGAALAMANNVLLLYSRQVYVLDPVAPFVVGLYCAAIGLQRGSRFHWCAAGFLSAWALIGYYTSVTFAPVFAAILAYLAIFYPRTLWANRAGLMWFMAGAVIVYLPMLAEEFSNPAVLYRAKNILIFLKPDGSFNWDPELWKRQLGSSFGSIFFFAETAPWVVGTGESVGMRYGSVLCGIGATYLFLSWRTPATFLLIAWTVVCIFLGCATLPDTPTFYHMLAAVIPLMLASAVTLDRALALTDRLRPIPIRALMWVGTIAVLAAATTTQVQAVWVAVRRQPPAEGKTVYNANARIMAARYINEHPDYRFYIVRNAANTDATSDNEIFRFFAADSDVSDISNDLADALPVPPVEPERGAAFIILPARRDDGPRILEAYPTAKVEEVIAHPTERIQVYVVDAATVRSAYEARRGKEAGASVTTDAS